jgi:hypothetical protein
MMNLIGAEYEEIAAVAEVLRREPVNGSQHLFVSPARTRSIFHIPSILLALFFENAWMDLKPEEYVPL